MKHKKTENSEVTVNNEAELNVNDVVNVTPVDEVPENAEVVEGVNIVETEEPEVEPSEKLENHKSGSVAPGAVRNCKKLNLREEPSKSSGVACILLEDESVLIDLENSTDDFYKISARGIDGYCMKQFIEIL